MNIFLLNSDEAIFWAILSYKKLGQTTNATHLIKKLRKEFPGSRWTELLKKEKTIITTTSEQNYQYSIQFGAFSKKENAERFVKELKNKKVSAFITYSNNFYKVRTGKFTTYNEAKNYLQIIKEKGYNATIVKL